MESLLYGTPIGIQTLTQYDMDVRQAAAHMLGVDIATQIGPERVHELNDRWPGSRDDLVAEFVSDAGIGSLPGDAGRREEILVALESGWREGLSEPVDDDKT